MDDCDFSRHLLVTRLRHGLTQAELAARAGLSTRCISDLERGLNAAPRLKTAHALIEGLGLDHREARRLLDVATCARIQVRFGEQAARRTYRHRPAAAPAAAD